MRKADAVGFFGSEAELARDLGVTKGAVNQWGAVVPYASAKALAEKHPDDLKLDESLYDNRLRPIRTTQNVTQ